MLFQARSIKTFDTAARASFCFTKRRTRKSVWRNSGNSLLEAYQRDRQSLLSASRKPMGLTFCPIKSIFVFRRLLLCLLFCLRFGSFGVLLLHLSSWRPFALTPSSRRFLLPGLWRVG